MPNKSSTPIPTVTVIRKRARIRSMLMSIYALVIYLVLIVSITSMLPGLVACGARTQAAENAVIDCGEAAVKAELPNLLPTIAAVLTGGSVDWNAQLDAIERWAGPSAVACSVSAITAAWNAPPTGSGTALGSAKLEGRSRGAQYIQAKGYRFKAGSEAVAPSSSTP